jgi:hypothetical protein
MEYYGRHYYETDYFKVIIGIVIVVLWSFFAGPLMIAYTIWQLYKLSPFVKVPDAPAIDPSSLKLNSTEIENIKKYLTMSSEMNSRLSIVSTQDIAKRKDGFYQERSQKAIDYNKEWSQLIDKMSNLSHKINDIRYIPGNRIKRLESILDDRVNAKKQKFIAKLYLISAVVLLFLDYAFLGYKFNYYYPMLLAIPLSYLSVLLYKENELSDSYMALVFARKYLESNTLNSQLNI